MAAEVSTGSTGVGDGGLPIGEGLGRQVDYWLTVYRRTWQGTAVSSFVAPLFYVLAMGVLLGGFIDVDPDKLEGAHVVPRLRGAGLGCRPGHADRGRRDDLPRDGDDQVGPHLRLDARDAAPGARPGPRAPRVRDVPGGHHLCGLHAGGRAVRGVRHLVGSPAGVRLAGAGGHGVRVAGLCVHDPADLARGLRGALPAGHLPAVPLLGRVLPHQQPRPRGRVGGSADAAVAWRQPVADVLPRHGRLVLGGGQHPGPGRR